MKNRRFFIVQVAMLGALIFSLTHKPNYLTCQVIYRNDINLKVNYSVIKTEIASNQPAQEKGLGGRSCIGSNEAMLFVFNRPDYYSFWMKDMHFPIDIIWLGADKRIVYIQPNVSPATYPQSFINTAPAQYVLELQAGSAGRLNLRDGSRLQF